MKMKKAGLVVLAIFLAISWIGLGRAEAQPDLSIWVDQWFKIKFKQIGYKFNGEKLSSDRDSIEVSYMKIWKWSPLTSELNADIYYQRTYVSDWVVFSGALNYFTGTDLDLLVWFDYSTDNVSMTFLAHLEGKLKNLGLKKAKFESLGGYYLERDAAENISRGVEVVLDGELVEAIKVKVPPDIILH